jgi:hypothetical protein
MKAAQVLLRDRRRAQRGSVLSGVLMITAFLAIISGALVTELSTHFLISRTLVNRVANEATVNSAMELAVDQLQTSALASNPTGAAGAWTVNGCPSLSNLPVTVGNGLNGRKASVSYISCWPTVRASALQYTSVASASSFSVDGTHSVIPSLGQDIYLVGDSGGRIYQYAFGLASPTPGWPIDLRASITGPPIAMLDVADRQDISYLVPIRGGGGSGCTANACVELLHQDGGLTAPTKFCFMAANSAVTSRPAAGVAYPEIAYFGDTGGTLYAYNATEFSCSTTGGPAAFVTSKTNPSSAAIVAGPVVLKNGARDEIYVVTSKGSTAQLLWYEYQQSPVSLTLKRTLPLPYPSPKGLAPENSAVAPRIAITFQDGGVAIYNTNASYDPTWAADKALGAGIAGAPYWCSCPPAGPQIGIASVNGTLYVRDVNLAPVASFQVPVGIHTTPASDGAGQWYFGADDGTVYAVQQSLGLSMVQVARYGEFGRVVPWVGSSVQVAGCSTGICIYWSSANKAYSVSLDARNATLTACLYSAPTCSGDNPRLWARVEVGASGGPQTARVQGWSYYSP